FMAPAVSLAALVVEVGADLLEEAQGPTFQVLSPAAVALVQMAAHKMQAVALRPGLGLRVERLRFPVIQSRLRQHNLRPSCWAARLRLPRPALAPPSWPATQRRAARSARWPQPAASPSTAPARAP